MKIAFMHFWTLRLPRGVETLTLSLANELSKRGQEVSILTARSSRQPLVASLPSVVVKEFPTFRYFEFATIAPFYAVNLVHQKYDVVITFFADFGEGWALQLAAPFARPRHVLYLTFPYKSAPHRYDAYKYWNWGSNVEHILADAEYTAQDGASFFGRPVINLPSGTNPERFLPDPKRRTKMRKDLGFNDDDIVLLNVAALEKRKGAWRVIEALPKIREHCGNVRYLILGDGSQKSVLQKRVVELGLDDLVMFAGTTTNLESFYNAADIFVMLPDAEAGSIACLEAMASGLPVIVSKSGGFDEVVKPNCGRIIDIERQNELIEAVAELRNSSELRHALGMNGRQRIIQEFSWGTLAERLIFILSKNASSVGKY
jgi:glycosyltransferase involved in cell wall biosynthesis